MSSSDVEMETESFDSLLNSVNLHNLQKYSVTFFVNLANNYLVKSKSIQL